MGLYNLESDPHGGSISTLSMPSSGVYGSVWAPISDFGSKLHSHQPREPPPFPASVTSLPGHPPPPLPVAATCATVAAILHPLPPQHLMGRHPMSLSRKRVKLGSKHFSTNKTYGSNDACIKVCCKHEDGSSEDKGNRHAQVAEAR